MLFQHNEAGQVEAFYHTINNRINALGIGIGILQQHDEDQVREIADVMEDELDNLQAMLDELRHKLGH